MVAQETEQGTEGKDTQSRNVTTENHIGASNTSEQNEKPGAGGATPVSLALLREAREAQGAHGLKLRGDFLRYRRYCTRRINRVRRATNTTNGRARYDPCPITAEHVQRDMRTLLIPLYNAERAWAFAMDVKRSEPAGPARTHRTVISRLTKAVSHALHLRTLCMQSGADSDTCLEAEAYARWMSATLSLEHEQWAAALSDFEVSHKVYGGLAGVRAGTAAAAVFEEKSEEITQAMRFCRYNIARENGDSERNTVEADADLRGLAADASHDNVLAEKIEGALAAARKRAAASLGKVEWCGSSVELRSEVVREAVLAVKEEADALAKRADAREADHFDKLFMAYADANKVVQNEIKQFRQATAARSEERIEELELVAAYLSYGRLTNTVQRNKLLIEALRTKRNAKPEDFVRLYDNIIHNVADISALSGVSDNAELAMRLDDEKSLYTAHKCLHLARCYLAGAMYDAANELFARVPVHAETLANGGGDLAQEAKNLVRDAAGLRVRAQAQLFLREARATEHQLEADARQPAMCNNMDRMVSFAKQKTGSVRCIAEVPPRLQAVPCKPVLFDLALDAIAFPGDAEKEAEKKATEALVEEQKKEPEAKGALAGTRLARWWSGARS